ncbi:MAG TPA: tetratricopeptide repeat protein [Vicinamibacterales bacterium]|nr:tetratricopeptide repeat protein [Vicinamibacterales bacterium]
MSSAPAAVHQMLRALTLIGVAALAGAVTPTLAQRPSARVLVVPFETTQTEPRFYWLSEASAVLLADGLRDRGVSAITRTERQLAFERLHLPMSGSLTRATVIKVAELVDAGEVIVGSFKVEGDDIVVKANSVRVDVGKLEPPVSERGPLNDLFGVFDRLSRRFSAGAPANDSTTRARPPLGAFENFVKGLVAENPASQATFLESAIQEWPAFDRARLALWEVRSDQGDHAAALAAVRSVQAGARLSSRAAFFAAVSELRLQRYDEAFGGFLKLLEHSTAPNEGTGAGADAGALYNNLGVVQIRRGSSNGGTATYFLTKATEAERDNPDYMFNLGYAYLLDHDHAGATYWLREMLRRDPTDADAHYLLAAALQASGSTPEAAREKDLARRLSSRYEEIERRAANDPLPVSRGLERIQTEPDSSRTLQTDQAIVGPAQREQRELASFHLERGRRFFEREQYTDAMSELRRAVYLSPYEAQAHLLIGRIHLRAGRPAEAIDALKISLWSADTAAARTALGEAYLKTGDSVAARREGERALVLDPASEGAKRLLAQIK